MKRRKFLKQVAAGSALAMLPLSWVSGKNEQTINGPQPARGPVYNIKNYGAKGDGTTLNTEAIQEAIDACHSKGGGMVYIPSGDFLSGTLILKSHVNLHLSSGATLLGSTDLNDFQAITPEFLTYAEVNYTDYSLLYAEKAENISITGGGTIDGQGEEEPYQLEAGAENYLKRPYIIRMNKCKDINIRNVTIKNSPMWVQNYMACDDLNIHNITVHSTVNHNNDGIDIDGCHNVRISDCNIRSGDDAIVLKSLSPRMCKNITITNCVLSSICNAFKLGTESTGGFKNIVVTNCTMYDTRLSGIALEIVDGGTMDQILISNIVMRNVKGGIFVRLGDRARPYLSRKSTVQHLPEYEMEEQYANPKPGVVKNIMIKNIIATGIGNVGCSVVGLPKHKIENVRLKDMSIQYDGGGKKEWVTREVPENREGYPEFDMFGPLPAYGFYCRHVKNLELSDLSLSYDKDEYRPAIFLDDVENYNMEDLELTAPKSDFGKIMIKDAKN